MNHAYKVALIGFGNVAERGHCTAILSSERLRIVAVYDPVEKRLGMAKRLLPDCRLYSDIDQMFSEVSVDLVIICSPPVFHYDAVMKGLSENCHVVCEKPVLTKLEDYKKVQEYAALVHKMVYPCHNYKFAPSLQKAKQIIESGHIGKVRHILMSTIRASHARGSDDWHPDWRREKQISGGGIVSDHAIHSIYLSTYWLNETPTDVASMILNSEDYSDTEDTASITLRFNTKLCHIFLSWNGSRRATEYFIEGDEGSLSIDDQWLILKRRDEIVLRERIEQSGPNTPVHSHWYQKMYQDVVRCLDDEDYQPGLLNEAMVAADVVDKVYEMHRLATAKTVP